MSVYGGNQYGQYAYGGPTNISIAISEAGTAQDSTSIANVSGPLVLTGVQTKSGVGSFTVEESKSFEPTGVYAISAVGSFTTAGSEHVLTGAYATSEIGSFSIFNTSAIVPLTGVFAKAIAGYAGNPFGVGLYDSSIYGSAAESLISETITLRGVSTTSQVGIFSASVSAPRTFFIASTTQNVIVPGMQMYPTTETISFGSSPYIVGSSQFYTIGQVIWNGAVKVEGVDWEFVSPFRHIIKILNPPSLGIYGGGQYGLGDYSFGQVAGIPITLVYSRWNIQVSTGFQVISYPVPFSFTGTTIVADSMPPIDQYFTVRFIANRIANNPQTLFSIFPVMVDDMLADHTAYDEPNGFQTYRPNCYQVLDTILMQIFEWTGSAWVATSDVPNGTSFYVKSLRAIYQNDLGVAVLKYTAGGGPDSSYPQAITYPPFGEGIGKNLLVDGFSSEAATNYPAAYQVCSTPGTYDLVCQDEGFDHDFDFAFDGT